MFFVVGAVGFLLAQATPGFCVPGAHVEGLAAGRWYPATVVKPADGGQCVVHMTYSGIEDDWYMPPEKVRPVGGAPEAGPASPNHVHSGICSAGDAVEIRLQQRWWPATVEEDGPRPDGRCRVKHDVYAGTEQLHDIPMADIRAAQGVGPAGQPDTAGAKGLVSTTPQQISDAFHRDPEGSKARLIGATVRLTGTADVVDDKNILFKIAGYELAAQCLFEPKDRAALAGVAEGAQVTVEGVATNQINAYGVRLQQCRLVSTGKAPKAAAILQNPPPGRYYCMNAGSSVGSLQIGGGRYTIGGVTGGYTYNSATKRFTWTGGSFAKWGWTGQWRTDSVFTNGPAEPRIELTDGMSLHVHCFPKG